MLIKQQLLNNGWGPGGWMYYQPETNWHAPNPLGNTFAQQVDNIVKHRLANPRFPFSTEPASVAKDLEEYTLARWRKTYSEHGLQKFLENPDDSIKKKHNEWLSTSKLPKSLLGKVAERVGIDTSVVEEWLGAGGKHAGIAVATHRALVCQDCPGNQKAGWKDLLTVAGAKALREYLGVKNMMALSTNLDKDLGMCAACKCVLELKIWAPIDHIHNHLTAPQREKLYEYNQKCWVLEE